MIEKLHIKECTKIYVACPSNSATGGPELLHQLVRELVNFGFDAYMYYYGRTENKSPIHDAYMYYDNKFVSSIEDTRDNIIIVPETNTGLIYQYNKIQKIIWWLSVDNYFYFLSSNSKIKRSIKYLLYNLKLYPKEKIYRFNKKDKIMHFVQSEYAKQMLENKGIKNYFFLGDYLNMLFIEQQINYSNMQKENIVIYNPKKGIEFTKLIMAEAKNIKFIPIENMTRDEVSNLLLKAKVYIDFGNHPGKDRIPREAAISGCCVITGRDGSAKFYEDIPIENEFKYDSKVKNIPLIIKKIKNCFYNWAPLKTPA